MEAGGVETLLDFVDDDVPFQLIRRRVGGGGEGNTVDTQEQQQSIICIPYSMETTDFSLVLTRNLSPREYAAATKVIFYNWQRTKESSESGIPSVGCVGMHTFVAGTSAAANELDNVLNRLKLQQNIDWATACEVTESIQEGDGNNGPSEAVAAALLRHSHSDR